MNMNDTPRRRFCESDLAKRMVMYTDTVGGEQTCRDDLWAVTTEELNGVHAELTHLRSESRDTDSYVSELIKNLWKIVGGMEAHEPGTNIVNELWGLKNRAEEAERIAHDAKVEFESISRQLAAVLVERDHSDALREQAEADSGRAQMEAKKALEDYAIMYVNDTAELRKQRDQSKADRTQLIQKARSIIKQAGARIIHYMRKYDAAEAEIDRLNNNQLMELKLAKQALESAKNCLNSIAVSPTVEGYVDSTKMVIELALRGISEAK